MSEFLWNAVGWWVLAGYVVTALLPSPKTKAAAVLQLVIGGPCAWLAALSFWSSNRGMTHD